MLSASTSPSKRKKFAALLGIKSYHFSRYHESLRIRMEKPIERKGKQRAREYRKMTLAVVAGLAGRRCSVIELINYPLP